MSTLMTPLLNKQKKNYSVLESLFKKCTRGGWAVAILLALFASLQPLRANADSTNQVKPMASSQSGACGVRVYMTASGTSGTDTNNDLAVKASLENDTAYDTTLCITIGAQYYDLSTVAANITTSNFDVIYLQGQNNWSNSNRSSFGSTDLQVIEDFLAAGGGLVVGEWHAWNACASTFTDAWAGLDALMPAIIKSNCDYESNVKVRFYRWERPLSTLLDTGVAADFIFEPADFAGSLSELTLKPGATPYYYALWNSDANQIPSAVAPAQLPADAGVGMAGWVPAGKEGRVFSFATTNGAPELLDTSLSNSFRRLLVNSLGWAGSVGGSINPDTIAVTSQAGGSLSTPSFVPTRISGNVTYSIVSGTLPEGLTFDPTNGQISGTPTEHGDIDITIQAVGSTSGQAQALITLKIAASNSSTQVGSVTTTSVPTTTVAPATTVAQATSPTTAIASTTTTTVTTQSEKVASAASLPKTGNSPDHTVTLAFLLLLVGIGLIQLRTRRRY